MCGVFGADAMLAAWEERCVNVRSKFDTELPHLAGGDTREEWAVMEVRGNPRSLLTTSAGWSR